MPCHLHYSGANVFNEVLCGQSCKPFNFLGDDVCFLVIVPSNKLVCLLTIFPTHDMYVNAENH